MNAENRQLGDALLGFGSTEDPATARRQADKIRRRDNLRVRALAGLTVFFAALAAAGVSSLIYFLHVWISPPVHAIVERLIAGKSSATDLQTVRAIFYWGETASMWVGVSSAVALMLAVLSAVLLIFASRRAALRQVNVSLLDISNQLRQLQQSIGK
jgi:hypothetical protein